MLAAGYDDLIGAMRPPLGLVLDRLTHPSRDQEVVVAAEGRLLSGVPGGGVQPGPRKT